jgi:hypothetical protein
MQLWWMFALLILLGITDTEAAAANQTVRFNGTDGATVNSTDILDNNNNNTATRKPIEPVVPRKCNYQLTIYNYWLLEQATVSCPNSQPFDVPPLGGSNSVTFEDVCYEGGESCNVSWGGNANTKSFTVLSDIENNCYLNTVDLSCDNGQPEVSLV